MRPTNTVEYIAFAAGIALGAALLAAAFVWSANLMAPHIIELIHWLALSWLDLTGAPTLPTTDHRSLTA